ncbi:MAG TPA: ASCH domain-containing protein [Mycobacterium sp.]|nr:ASCH domain-containing protein [Mycobacterium sp.]
MSIHPSYAEAIVSGRKRAEFRKRRHATFRARAERLRLAACEGALGAGSR